MDEVVEYYVQIGIDLRFLIVNDEVMLLIVLNFDAVVLMNFIAHLFNIPHFGNSIGHVNCGIYFTVGMRHDGRNC